MDVHSWGGPVEVLDAISSINIQRVELEAREGEFLAVVVNALQR